MNVLLTSAGRRTTLVQAFAQAVHRRGALVYAADMDGLAPALYLADRAIRLPRVLSEEYVSTLLGIVRDHQIRMLIPTIDTELPVLADAAPAFEAAGCQVIVSAPRVITIAGDKWETVREFSARNVRVPRSWLPGNALHAELPGNLFVKPRDGSASQHTYRVEREELHQVLERVPHPIIQEDIRSPEITIDALLDMNGRLIHYVPRRRIRTLAGESIQGSTLPDGDLREWICHVLSVVADLGGKGPITVQAFLTPGGPTLLEINPRFGGGFPLALAAGGDYPELLLRMLEGQAVEPHLGEYKPNLYMTRHYVEVFTEAPKWE